MMRLYFCGCCGQSIQSPDHSVTAVVVPVDVKAIAAWQDEIARECQHVPLCVGPWQHAVRVVREAWANGAVARTH